MAIKWSASSINIFNISKHFQSFHSYTYNINICIRRQRDFMPINYHLTHDRCLNFSLNFMEHRFNQFYFIFTLLNRKNISIHIYFSSYTFRIIRIENRVDAYKCFNLSLHSQLFGYENRIHFVGFSFLFLVFLSFFDFLSST